jgi:acetyl esterase/lipase
VFHAGGLLVGSSEIIPRAQIDYLTKSGFVVVIPNYRLAPQVTGKEAFTDCEEAYDWAVNTLPKLMESEHSVQLDVSKTVALGHSSGGSIALHLASCRPVKAVTAFYPSLFNADTSTSAHRPMTAPPFGMVPDFDPNDEEWASIAPADKQVSEVALALPGTVPAPRNKWQMSLIKNGQWMQTVQPDGDFASIDPMTRITSDWCPVMLVQGEVDNIGGSSLDLAQRAEKAMREKGVGVELEVVKREAHMFDLPPTVGTSDLGPKWVAVKKGLDWLVSHV